MFLDGAKARQTGAVADPGTMQPALVRAAIIGAFAILVVLAWIRNVNWDEFYYLSQVHDHLNDRLDRPLQTFHVHFFGWLAAVPGHEMIQISVARLVITIMLGITAVSIWQIARIVTGQNRQAAGIAVVAFLTSGYVLAHGASFRTDPIASALLMSALAILMTARLAWWQVTCVALLGALAVLVTIKSALYAPALLGALLWRMSDKAALFKMVCALVLSICFATGLYLCHATGVQAAPASDAAAITENAVKTTLLDAGLAPRLNEAILWLMLSVAPVALALFGIVKGQGAKLICTLLLFALPLVLSVIFYRNAFAYFFPFIVPPLMVAVAVGVDRLTSVARLNTFLVLMLLSGAWQASMSLSERATDQRLTIAEVHRLFPEPVAYIDQNAMISSFPRDVFFMSSWGTARYRAAGQPVMADLIARQSPPLLLATRDNLRQAMTAAVVDDRQNFLLPEDQRILRDTYVHYAGAIWLAGKQLTLGSVPVRVSMPISGAYRVESSDLLHVNGVAVQNGDVLDIHEDVIVQGTQGTDVTLIWDTGAKATQNTLSSDEHYAGFWQLMF